MFPLLKMSQILPKTPKKNLRQIYDTRWQQSATLRTQITAATWNDFLK